MTHASPPRLDQREFGLWATRALAPTVANAVLELLAEEVVELEGENDT